MYENLKKLLDERDITVAEMCRQTGVSPSTMSNLKARDGSLSVENVVKIARYLGVTVEKIVEG